MSIFLNATDSTVEQFYLKEDILHKNSRVYGYYILEVHM